MKKTLVALAALAAASAFAQSTVTLTGNLDFAGAKVSGKQINANGTTVSTTTGTSSTSVIKLTAVEDLGNGTKATVLYGLDPRSLANDSLGYTAYGDAKAQSNVVTGLARDEVFVGIEGAFGNLRLGAPNSLGLEAFGAASALGTGVGSGYAPNASGGTNSIVNTRYDRSARFDSPAFSGVTAHMLYAPGNDEAATETASSASDLNQALQIRNNRRTTEYGLKYANGPLNATLVQIKQAKRANELGWYGNQNATGAADATSATVFGANYKIADTTLYVGYNTGNRLAAKGTNGTWNAAAVDSRGYRYAVKQTIGKFDVMAQYSTQETTNAAANAKGVVKGLRADYNFSKTTAAYAGYESWDTGFAANANSTTGKGDRKIVSIGLRKSF
jgi:predicted porin